MYVPDKLKCNRFRTVAIPRPIDYFARFGYRVPDSDHYSGDELVPASGMRKVDSIVDYDAYDKMMQDEENSKTK